MSAAMLVALGCGSGNSLHGSVQGHSFTPRSAAFVQYPVGDSGGNALELSIVDSDDACGVVMGMNTLTGTSSVLAINFTTLLENGLAAPVVGTGHHAVTAPSFDYAVPPSYAVFGQYGADGQSLLDGAQAYAVLGDAVLSTYEAQTGGVATGTFDLLFAGTDSFTGSFHADFCDTSARL